MPLALIKKYSAQVFIPLLCLMLSSASYGNDIIKLQTMNIGGTSFMDGYAKPMHMFQISTDHYRADSFNNGNGDSITGDNNIEANVILLQWVNLTEYKIGNAYYGWEVLLPIADVDPDTDIPFLNKGERGVGDLIISPFMLQWTDSTLFGKPYFHRLNMIFALPTGDYGRNNDVNIGTNTWRFNPYYAGTLLLSAKWEASFRLHYLWSSENDQPHSTIFSGISDIQAGSAFHMNYSVSYETSPGFRIGLAGYYLDQLSRDRIDGQSQVDSGEKFHGIGPGFMWQRQDALLTVNSYIEFGAENHTEGYKLVVRYAWFFH